MSLHVFLGPTMPVEEARRICPAEYLPPVSMGDVYALMARRPSTIAIIDGTFQNKPAVWHKEILFALSRGVRVVGSSSMGALRAAELQAFGMEGVGAIYQAFRDGVYQDDDEVAVAHASVEHGYRALSEAMVNIRAALAEAGRRGLIGAATADALIAAAKRIFYPSRSWPAVFQLGRDGDLPTGELSALEVFIRAERPSLKRDDAVLLLKHLASDAPAAPRPAFTFESSWFWKKMMALEDRRRDALRPGGSPGGEIGESRESIESIEILEADLARPAHARDVVALTQAYARDPMGNGRSLAPEVVARLIPGLTEHPTTVIFLAYAGGAPVGIATCFRGFSTFQARPLLNIHDLGVVPDHRGRGVGARLLAAVERKARDLGCCRLTLEVQENNGNARRVYARAGFSQAVYETSAGAALFLVKPLD